MKIISKEHYNKSEYIKSIEYSLGLVEKKIFKDRDAFAKYFMNIDYSLKSCIEIKAYYNYLELFKMYYEIVYNTPDKEIPCGYHNNACFFQFNLMSLIYAYYDEQSVTKENLYLALTELEHWTEKTHDKAKFVEVNGKLKFLVEALNEDKCPYFEISLKLPFMIPLPNNTYNMKFNNKVVEINLNSFSSETEISMNKDRYFSDIKIKIEGFINCDHYWKGPSIDYKDEENFYINKMILDILNDLIVKLKLYDSSLKLHLLSFNDIGTTYTNQFQWNGDSFHSAIGLQMGGYSLVNVLTPVVLEEGSIDTFNNMLNVNEVLLYEKIYANSLIDFSIDNVTSAFILLNSAAESMVEYYLRSFCLMAEKESFYKDMLDGKSTCTTCEFYIDSTNAGKEEPLKGNIPSLMTQVKQVYKELGVSNTLVRNTIKYIIKIKQESLRNDTVHGRNNHITFIEYNNALDSYRKLENILKDRYKEIEQSL